MRQKYYLGLFFLSLKSLKDMLAQQTKQSRALSLNETYVFVAMYAYHNIRGIYASIVSFLSRRNSSCSG